MFYIYLLYIVESPYTYIYFQDRFPPNIYYKIYTHRPIQDLCANAPRDYTKSGKQRDMKCSHNKNYIINNSGNLYKSCFIGHLINILSRYVLYRLGKVVLMINLVIQKF